MESHLLEADMVVTQLFGAIRNGSASLGDVPGLLKRLIKENFWQERIVRRTGERVSFARDGFLKFVSEHPPEGLGSDLKTIKRLCEDDKEALDLLDQVTAGRQGERTDLFDNIQKVKSEESPTGTSAARALRKLRKDRPDLHAEVLAGEKSPHGAMVEAGFRKKTISIPISNPSQAAHSIATHFSRELLDELIRALIEEQRNLIAKTLQEATQ